MEAKFTKGDLVSCDIMNISGERPYPIKRWVAMITSCPIVLSGKNHYDIMYKFSSHYSLQMSNVAEDKCLPIASNEKLEKYRLNLQGHLDRFAAWKTNNEDKTPVIRQLEENNNGTDAEE